MYRERSTGFVRVSAPRRHAMARSRSGLTRRWTTRHFSRRPRCWLVVVRRRTVRRRPLHCGSAELSPPVTKNCRSSSTPTPHTPYQVRRGEDRGRIDRCLTACLSPKAAGGNRSGPPYQYHTPRVGPETHSAKHRRHGHARKRQRRTHQPSRRITQGLESGNVRDLRLGGPGARLICNAKVT